MIIIIQKDIPSNFIFEVSACITLFQTMIRNTLDVWILISMMRNRSLAYIIYSQRSVYKTKALHRNAGPEGQRPKCLKDRSDQSASWRTKFNLRGKRTHQGQTTEERDHRSRRAQTNHRPGPSRARAGSRRNPRSARGERRCTRDPSLPARRS